MEKGHQPYSICLANYQIQTLNESHAFQMLFSSTNSHMF